MKTFPIAALAAALLAGCSSGPTFTCNAAGAQAAVGKLANIGLMEDARREANARMVRTISPGQAVTQEFNAERLTLDVDANNVVQRARCG